MKKIILTIIIIGLVSFGGYLLFKKEEPPFTLFEVIRGDVVEEIRETGKIQRGEKINLSFKSTGEIEKIYVRANQVVERGEALAKLDTRDLKIQLQEAKSALAVYQAQLQKLLAGATKEEIQKVQTDVTNAEIALEKAKQNLTDVVAKSEENLTASYQDAIRVSEAVYLDTYNAKIFVDLIQRTYFTASDQEGLRVIEYRDKIGEMTSEIKSQIDGISSTSEREKIDQTLPQIENNLSVIYNSLNLIRDICESPAYRGKVSDAHKTSLDTHRTTINTTLTNLVSVQQTISSTKVISNSNINTAQAEVSLAEGKLQAAKDQLALILAPPREEDLNLYRAQVNQAKAKVEHLENQINEAVLRSPVKAQVAAVNKREGELVQPMLADVVVSLLPLVPFEIVADIYEEDIVKVEIGSPVEISLPAFPGKTFKGNVTFIDETEKIIESVVYYEIKIAFVEAPAEGVKPTMTADIVIRVGTRENVLIVPREAIKRVGDRTIVEVFADGLIKEREIEIGLRSDDVVEILSGLEEGEKVVIR